jgi:YbbR domain-containing protein
MAFRDYITNNFWWKLLSLLLAAFTWLTIQTGFERDENLRQSPVVTTSMRHSPAVPITVLTAPGNQNQYAVDPPAVSVDIFGSEQALKKLEEKEVHFYVDMTDSTGQEKKVRRAVHGLVPPGLTITNQDPINVTVERLNSIK